MPSLVTLIDGTVPVAADFNGNYTALNNAIGSSTAISTWVLGEIPYSSATDTLSRLAPGAIGKVLTMTSTVPNWEGGAWITPGFSAGDFTGGGSQTWTVAAGDVTTYAYVLIGKTMTLAWNIQTSSVGGTPHPSLFLKIPAGKFAAKSTLTFGRAIDAGAAAATSLVVTSAASALIDLRNNVAGGTNWAAATDTTEVGGIITFEIQ